MPDLKCPVCSGSDCRYLFTRRGHEDISLDYEYTYLHCGQCHLRFLSETEHLPQDIYLHEFDNVRRDAEPARRYVHWDDAIVREIARIIPSGRLLDFGSGYGDMLAAARTAGFAAEGIDISPVFAEAARALSRCPVYVGPIEGAGYSDGQFDVVNATGVLECISNLGDVFHQLARVVRPGGLLRVSVFSPDCLGALIRRERWWFYAPTHVCIVADRTLRHLASQNSLTVDRVFYGGEQPLKAHLAQRVKRSLPSTILDTLRYGIDHAHIGPFSGGTIRAYYLRKPSP